MIVPIQPQPQRNQFIGTEPDCTVPERQARYQAIALGIAALAIVACIGAVALAIAWDVPRYSGM